MTDGRQFAVHPQAIWEVLEGEVVIANLDGGSYYTVGGSGVTLWRGLAAGRAVDDVVDDVSAQVGADRSAVAAHVTTLVDQLMTENLLSVSDGTADGPPEPVPADESDGGREWVVPTFEKFTDMQQLLMLDPIHDVDETGWPTEVEPT